MIRVAATSWQLAAIALLIASQAHSSEPTPEQAAFFEQHVRPLLIKSCLHCHGPKKQESGLRLDSRTALMRGGDDGPVVVPGKPERSKLVKVIRHEGDVQMPPTGRLADDQVRALVRWVEMGAPWTGDVPAAKVRGGEITEADRRFWSFRPVRRPPVPSVRDTGWCESPVDRFILARLEEKGLRPAPQADRRVLIRRVTFDLTGLPPTPEEVDAFESDHSPGAWTRLVDRLLASSAYGERWGRHWLDIVRYADTAGETADYPVREAYLYRNWVIGAFNRDMPYDQFLREQIAGDILAASAPAEKWADLVTATGFLAISRRFGFDPENYHHLTIQDTIDTVGQAVLGLSLGCARCHHHKFDPVTTADYYALYGIFASTVYAFPGSEEKKRPRDFVPLVPPAEAEMRARTQEKELARLSAELAALEKDRASVEATLKKASPGLEREQARERVATLAARRGQLLAHRASLAAKSLFPVAYAVHEGTPVNTREQKRGEPRSPGEEVPRRFLTILGGQPVPQGAGSGRLQLAGWISSAENPLTARVVVNRLWQHHFGKGLVATPNDFGARGRLPSHPELLDWLAAELVERGWSLKALHRLLLTSRCYRVRSDSDAASPDTENAFLSHYPRRRLEAEAIRDAILFVSGKLQRGPGGPHPFPPVESWSFTQHNPFTAVYNHNGRSAYLMTQRLRRHPFLALFDGADPSASTPTRSPTTVPTQALYFLNDPFVHEQSEAFARRLVSAPGDDSTRVALAWRTALARSPRPDEVARALDFLRSYRADLALAGASLEGQPRAAWAALCRTLLSRNEFVFLD